MKNEAAIRAACFVAIFIIIAIWERLARRRPLSMSRKSRWTSNLGIMLVNPFLVRLVFPVLAVTLAVKARQQGWGVLNNVNLPYGFELVTGIVVLDLAIYLQHAMFHAVSLFLLQEAVRFCRPAMKYFNSTGLQNLIDRNLDVHVLNHYAELRGINAPSAGQAISDGSYESLVGLMESCDQVVGIL